MLISVIVPVYNGEAYIEECVESILNQTYPTFEVILVNDGSRDASGEICEALQKKDGRIRVYHQENQGAAVARNFGLKQSQGEVISFVDADDSIDKEMFQDMLTMLIQEELDMVICESWKVYQGRKEKILSLQRSIYSREEMLKKMLQGRMHMSPTDKLYRRSVLPKEDLFPPHKIGEDHQANYACLLRSKRIGTLDRPYYFYRQDNLESVTKKKINPQILDVFEIKAKILKDVKIHFPEISKEEREAYLIPTAIYTKARLLTEGGELLSEEDIKRIDAYYQRYKTKVFTNPYVSPKIQMTQLLIQTGWYPALKRWKTRLQKRG